MAPMKKLLILVSLLAACGGQALWAPEPSESPFGPTPLSVDAGEDAGADAEAGPPFIFCVIVEAGADGCTILH